MTTPTPETRYLYRLKELHPLLKLCRTPRDAEALHGLLTSKTSLKDFTAGADLNTYDDLSKLTAAHVARSLSTR